MKTVQAVLPAILIFLSLVVIINPVSSGATIVKVDPSLIEYHDNATGQQFTVAVKIEDVTNLYGFDIKLRWNTTFLDYVSYSVLVPNDTYPGGVLWNPIIFAMNEVNTTAGTYWTAYSSRYPAPSFNGSGTVFTMTFRVKYHPVQPTANIRLELYSTDLVASDASSIPHTTQHGTVILHALTAGHDVAVTDIKSSKTVIGQGYKGNITVTAENHGGFTETFDVTAYANATIIASQAVTLTSGNFTTITFTWNTSGSAKGNYTISAYAEPVSGETDTADNTCTDGVVTVTIPGDVDGNRDVDILDVVKITSIYAAKLGDPPFKPNSDIDGDGTITILDVVICTSHYAQSDP